MHGSPGWTASGRLVWGRALDRNGAPAMPFKANRDRRHHIPKQRHQVTNWATYDASLRARGSLTVWFTAEAMEAWKAERRTGRGGQPRYSDLAIATALTAAPEQTVNFPLRCRLPGGERATITVEEETGKIDLNTASPTALTRFFTALTGDQSRGTQIAAQIIEFRKPKAQGTPSAGPAGTRFTTIMQLDQIDGMFFRISIPSKARLRRDPTRVAH